jgi:predicted transcriptional regulator of viral defense system
MSRASDYVTELAAQGQYHFTTQDVVEALGDPVLRVRAELRRLKAKGILVDPYRGFHVILPPEHQRLGCPPATDFVPPLMQHLHEPYYVALLSAAELYGAAPADHLFQVMTRLGRKPIDCGASRVQFLGRKDHDRTPVTDRRVTRGTLRVASPEATALELVGYVNQSGGLRHVSSIVSELADGVLDPDRLVSVAPLSPIVWAQRLGYLLDLTDHRALASALVPVVKELAQDFAPLVRAQPKMGTKRIPRWKLAVNADV